MILLALVSQLAYHAVSHIQFTELVIFIEKLSGQREIRSIASDPTCSVIFASLFLSFGLGEGSSAFFLVPIVEDADWILDMSSFYSILISFILALEFFHSGDKGIAKRQRILTIRHYIQLTSHDPIGYEYISVCFGKCCDDGDDLCQDIMQKLWA